MADAKSTPSYSSDLHFSVLQNRGGILYLSGINMTEGILTKNYWLRVPPKSKEAKLKIVGGDFIWILPTRS